MMRRFRGRAQRQEGQGISLCPKLADHGENEQLPKLVQPDRPEAARNILRHQVGEAADRLEARTGLQ